MYRGEIKRFRPPLGIKPTKEDRALVQALSVMGVGVREICVRMGERLALEKPLSRMSLYHHFRGDLLQKARGRHPSTGTLKRRVQKNIAIEMKRLIAEAANRGKKV